MDYFDIPKTEDHILKVIGVGGGGSNAVENMLLNNIKDVELIICNTDRQALDNKEIEKKILIGSEFNDGEGAGANPEIGAKAANESKEELKKHLEGAKMLFITAGMGGGTGTGAAPVIASIAKDLDILVIGIVTVPFEWEGEKKRKQAMVGVEELNKNCDSLILIYNDKITEIYPDEDLGEAFKGVDDVLLDATKGIVEIVSEHRKINVDIKDIHTTMSNSGTALMGVFKSSGENKAKEAIQGALRSPLLGIDNIKGAKKALLSITVSNACTFTSQELTTITNYLKDETDGAEIILGWGKVENLDADLMVTVIITGFKNSKLNLDDKKPAVEIPSDTSIKDIPDNSDSYNTSNQNPDLFETQSDNEKKKSLQTELIDIPEPQTISPKDPILSKTPPTNIPLTVRDEKIQEIIKKRKKKEEEVKMGTYKCSKTDFSPTSKSDIKEKWAHPYQHEVKQKTIDVEGNIRPNSYIHDKPD